MELTDKIMAIREFREEREKFEIILAHALQRESYMQFDKNLEVLIPKNIRGAYFELFANSVDKRSIQHTRFMGVNFLESEAVIPFYGRSVNGANFVLKYLPNAVNLEISSYAFNGNEKGVGIAEIGLFSTYKNKDRNFQTDLRIGETFKYRCGFNANHSISKVIDKIQEDKIIPHISQDILKRLPGFERSLQIA